MFCTQCGQANVDNARFCNSCGKAINQAPNVILKTPEASQEASTGLAIFVGVFVVLLFIGIIIILYGGSTPSSPEWAKQISDSGSDTTPFPKFEYLSNMHCHTSAVHYGDLPLDMTCIYASLIASGVDMKVDLAQVKFYSTTGEEMQCGDNWYYVTTLKQNANKNIGDALAQRIVPAGHSVEVGICCLVNEHAALNNSNAKVGMAEYSIMTPDTYVQRADCK